MKIGVIGLGIMGSGILQCLIEKGMHAVGVGHRQETLEALRESLSKSAKMGVRRKRTEAEKVEKGLATLELAAEFAVLTSCDLILEAVPEDFHTKVQVITAAAAALPHSIPFATNTSCLSVRRLAEACNLSGRFFGLHFMNPVPGSSLVELIRHEGLNPVHLDYGRTLVTAMGFTAVELSDSPGFIVNRLLMPIIAEAARLLESGDAEPVAIDTAMRLGCNHPMGPLALADMIGLDIILKELRQLEHDLGPRFEPAENLCQLVADGHLGRKSGKGFYHYGRK